MTVEEIDNYYKNTGCLIYAMWQDKYAKGVLTDIRYLIDTIKRMNGEQIKLDII